MNREGLPPTAFIRPSIILNKEAIRNLRSAQNIICLGNKYGKERLEAAFRRAVFYGSYKYGSIKNILERELDNYEDFGSPLETQLSTEYARSIGELLNKEILKGNIYTN